MVFRLWNQFKTSSTVTSKVTQIRQRASRSAQDCYLALSSPRHRRTTAPHFARDLVAGSTGIGKGTTFVMARFKIPVEVFHINYSYKTITTGEILQEYAP
ncbi:hypothetical protein TNCV_3713781 [Trichonephila clavipes]|nr:hypothetical protein TNCV_3713781 [Trichonephila clavipes]